MSTTAELRAQLEAAEAADRLAAEAKAAKDAECAPLRAQIAAYEKDVADVLQSVADAEAWVVTVKEHLAETQKTLEGLRAALAALTG